MSPADYFSTQASEYARFRPHYPEALFAYLACVPPNRQLAWDVATGSGQAACGLANYFTQVVATDQSAEQLTHATPHPAVDYRCEPAEKSSLADRSVSLVTVATAAHWFDLDAFYPEVRRVLVPNGVIALWAYSQPVITPEVDGEMRRFYYDVVGPYWPPGREKVEDEYRSLPFPFAPLTPPPFQITVQWTFRQVLGYVETWSALAQYRKHQGTDPLVEFIPQLRASWGSETETKTVNFPLFVKAGLC